MRKQSSRHFVPGGIVRRYPVRLKVPGDSLLSKMAAGSSGSTGNHQKFPSGSRVSCTTRNREKIEGEVLAFDHQYRILVLSIL